MRTKKSDNRKDQSQSWGLKLNSARVAVEPPVSLNGRDFGTYWFEVSGELARSKSPGRADYPDRTAAGPSREDRSLPLKPRAPLLILILMLGPLVHVDVDVGAAHKVGNVLEPLDEAPVVPKPGGAAADSDNGQNGRDVRLRIVVLLLVVGSRLLLLLLLLGEVMCPRVGRRGVGRGGGEEEVEAAAGGGDDGGAEGAPDLVGRPAGRVVLDGVAGGPTLWEGGSKQTNKQINK